VIDVLRKYSNASPFTSESAFVKDILESLSTIAFNVLGLILSLSSKISQYSFFSSFKTVLIT
jgi:hypothetical protein